MKRKIFKIPSMTGKPKQIVVELPHPSSVWYLVIEPNKAVPLVNLKNPTKAIQVLDAIAKQFDDKYVQWYVMNGYSKLK